jgi:hypothetical protein
LEIFDGTIIIYNLFFDSTIFLGKIHFLNFSPKKPLSLLTGDLLRLVPSGYGPGARTIAPLIPGLIDFRSAQTKLNKSIAPYHYGTPSTQTNKAAQQNILVKLKYEYQACFYPTDPSACEPIAKRKFKKYFNSIQVTCQGKLKKNLFENWFSARNLLEYTGHCASREYWDRYLHYIHLYTCLCNRVMEMS